jgi:hypothetical protein
MGRTQGHKVPLARVDAPKGIGIPRDTLEYPDSVSEISAFP